MYEILLSTHSILRWLVLIPMLIIIFKGFAGWFGGAKFKKSDKALLGFSVGMIHLQFVLGLVLYFVSPIFDSILDDFGGVMKDRNLRYFAVEHLLMMIISVVIVTIGSSKAKKKLVDKDKFRVIAIWFTIALIIIFIMIPWDFISFSPARPTFRGF